MKFEIGKYYQHTTGQKLRILCEAETTYHGNAMICEFDDGELRPVGYTEDAAVNYVEIPKNMWMRCQQKKELKELASPLMKWLSKNFHPHTTISINSGSAELMEGLINYSND